MTTITKELKTLREFGIDPLTGEAEGISGLGRVLCDLTKNGEQIIRDFLGLAFEGGFTENWNSGDNNNPHVSSFMLSRGMLEDLLIFCYLTKYKLVTRVKFDHCKWENLIALDNMQELNQEPDCEILGRYHKHGTSGSRNTHEMTGRTV